MKYFFLASVLLFLLAGRASCEDAPKAGELEEINVTATRTERSTKEIPAGTDTVTKEEIQNTRMFNLKEALIGISGVQSESKNGGYDSRLIIRGAGLKARYGVREIMILLDGVPITDPDGMSRLDFVDSQLVERIDVVKGPNSTLYGANAAGGVINIITKNPFEKRKSLTAGYGSDNTQMYNLNYGTSIDSTYLNTSFSRRSTDSWREWNKFRTSQVSFKGGRLLADDGFLEASASYTDADLQLPGSLTKEQFEDDIGQLTSEPWRNSGRYSKIFSANAKMQKKIGDLTLKPLAYYQTWSHFHPVTGLINDGGADIYGADFQADLNHWIAGAEGILTTGITGQIDIGDSEKYTYRDYVTVPGPSGRILSTVSDEKGDLAETGDDTTTKWGIYAQESLRPTNAWIVDLGIRYDQVAFDIDTQTYWEFDYSQGRYVRPAEAGISREKTFDAFSPRIGAVYSLNNIVNVYGNISTGFQTPQSSELSTNRDLKPLKVYNYETGVKAQYQDTFSMDLSLFYVTVKDEIVQTVVDRESIYNNAGESEKKGLELSGKVQTLPGLFAGGTYTYSDFTFEEFTEWISGVPYDRNGNRYPYIPVHQYSIFLYYKHPSGIKLKVDTNTWGEYYVDNANSDKYKGYRFLTNAFIGYEKGALDVGFDALNVFDKLYAMEVKKDNTGARYNPGAPLSLMARVTYKF